MKIKTAILLLMILTLSAIAPMAFQFAQAVTYTVPVDESVQDLHIDKDGYIIARQIKVLQIAGNSFYVRYYIGQSFIRILVKTDTKTKVFRKFGDEILLSQIVVGDTLNMEGKIENGSDNLSVMASKLTNFSNQKELNSYKGTISGMGLSTGSFILTTKNGVLKVQIATTTQIKKGNRIITAGMLKNGDVVTEAVGTYDHGSKTLDAAILVIYTDLNVFKPRNFQGSLKSIGNGNPITLILNADGRDYTVTLNDKTEILNHTRKTAPIKRFIEGDTLRIYGNLREGDEPIIENVEVVRNTSLQ